MKKTTIFAIGLSLIACDVDQTREGELPDVDVQVDEGQLPAYDVDWVDVDVGTTERTVEVPKVMVVMEEETVTVPVIDVTMPDDDRMRTERTLAVTPEVPHAGYDVDIEEIYASGGDLYVVATLEETSADSPRQKVRVSDRVVLNAPDLSVRYIILGERPEGLDNGQYTFYRNKAALPQSILDGRRIYEATS